MSKDIRFFSATCILTFLLTVSLLSISSTAFATSPVDAEDPTQPLAEDMATHSGDHISVLLGRIALQANSPLGFEGVISIELQEKHSGALENVLLDAMTNYNSESWVPTGTYSIKRTYVLNSDHFTVETTEPEIVVSLEEPARLTLTVLADPKFDDKFEEIRSAFVPDLPTRPAEDLESTPNAVSSADDSDGAIDFGRMGKPFIVFLSTALLVGLVLLTLCYSHKLRKH